MTNADTRTESRVVIITGASSGIGADLVRVFREKGFRVAALARRLDRLESLVAESGTPSIAVACDVSKRESIEAAFAEVRAKFGRIDGVVANAGFGIGGKAANLTTSEYRRQFDTNVFGVLDCFYAAKEELLARSGFFSAVGSVNSYVSLPATSAYCMSKMAVRGFTEALRWEMKPKGVSVTLICPGFVATEIRKLDNAGTLSAENDPVPPWLQLSSRKAAEKSARAILAGKKEAIFPIHAKIAVFLNRHFPWMLSPLFRSLGRAKSGTRKVPDAAPGSGLST